MYSHGPNNPQKQTDFMEDLRNFIDNGVIAYHIPEKTRAFISFFLDNYCNGVDMQEKFSTEDIEAVYKELKDIDFSNIYSPFFASYESFERILGKDYQNEKVLNEILLLNVQVIVNMYCYKVGSIIETNNTNNIQKMRDITPPKTLLHKPSLVELYTQKIPNNGRKGNNFDIQA